MTEIQDLIGIYGAVDRAISADPGLAELAAPFLGPYTDGAAIGWFDEHTAWTSERTGIAPADQYPDLESALVDLATIAPRGRMLARRLLAMTVAARVLGEVADVHDPVFVAPLAVDGLAADLDGADRLIELMLDDLLFPDLGSWEAFVTQAFAEGLVAESVLRQSTAPPCSGKLVMVDVHGDPDPVATISSHFCTDQLTLEQAKRFLDPAVWPRCSSLWCEMEQTGVSKAGNPVYREVVSVDCEHRDQVWTAEACLEFKLVNLPDGGALLTYDLCEGSPKPGDMVVVDSGSLTVVQTGNQVCVWTTKRIKFDHPFSGPSLALLTCALGYGAVAEDLVFSCALADGTTTEGSPFPGQDPPITQPTQPGDDPMAKPDTTATVAKDDGERESPDIKSVIDDAVDTTKRCIEECAEAYQSSYEKVSTGCYTADDLVQDAANMWTRMVRDVAKVADLSVKAMTATADRSTDRRAGD
ncbi:MAG: hypothetical protein ABL966_07015 [Acidimicrobiales bacterium]